MLDEIVERIMDNEKWPNIELPENLELLNEMADESFAVGTFSGMLSAVLMYHQLVEAMCLHVLESCHFLIQLSIHPATINFTRATNKMLGSHLNELKNTISFPQKEAFLEKVAAFNAIRNEVVHRMRKNNLDQISRQLRESKSIFDEIFELYDEIQDDFRVTFHGFKKDVFIDEYGEEDKII
jgi:hypothetical protein